MISERPLRRLRFKKGSTASCVARSWSTAVKTGWCAQHDEVTLAPAQARAYELPSESGQEGAGVWEFLMTIEHPTPAIVDSIESAQKWFSLVQIDGIKVQQITDATQSTGKDVVVVPDPAAKPLWARFYEIGTNRPFFCGRDGVKKYSLAEIENERRTGYSWYGDEPSHGLDDFDTWQPQWISGRRIQSIPSLRAICIRSWIGSIWVNA